MSQGEGQGRDEERDNIDSVFGVKAKKETQTMGSKVFQWRLGESYTFYLRDDQLLRLYRFQGIFRSP